jgi:hypothetical protein
MQQIETKKSNLMIIYSSRRFAIGETLPKFKMSPTRYLTDEMSFINGKVFTSIKQLKHLNYILVEK